MIWHPALEKRWRTLPEHQQVLMICNELNRASNLRSDPNEYRNALERALELMDFTIDDPRTRPRMREFLRARRVVAGFYLDPEPHETGMLQKALIQLYPSAWAYMREDASEKDVTRDERKQKSRKRKAESREQKTVIRDERLETRDESG